MVTDKTPNREIVAQNIEKQQYISQCMMMSATSKSSKEDLVAFMTEHNINFKDKDAAGNTILYYSIMGNNNSVFDLAVESCDIKQTFMYKYEKVSAVQAAVLAGNDYAVTKLLEKGENIDDAEIGRIVVVNNNLPAAKILAKHNYDFSQVKISGWGPEKTLIQWCRDKKYTELEKYFISLGYTE